MKTRYGPFGIHCFDRESGLNVLIDEISVPEGEWHQAPETISIAVHNACDLSCSFCYAPKSKASLAVSHVLTWAGLLARHGCLCVGFGGGEPTIYNGFPELCRAVRDQTDLAVTFTTHGHHLNRQYCDCLVGAVDLVRVSVDAVGTVYEHLRGRAFDELNSNLANLRASGLRFGISMLLNRRTFTQIDDVLLLAVDEGASELLLLPEVRYGRVQLAQEECRCLGDWIRTNQCRLPIKVSEIASSLIDVPYLDLPSWGSGEYEDTYQYMHIDSLGYLKGNSFQGNGIRIGECDDIMEALHRYRQHLR